MTLAEVFLLLLIVGWYGSRLESEERGTPADPVATVSKSEFDESERRRAEAEAKLTSMSRKYEELERILDWIAKTAGLAKPIRSVEEAKEAIDKVKFEAKRGRPACATDNVLVNVDADAGRLTATVRQEFSADGHTYVPGQHVEGAQIQSLLDDVGAFYRLRRTKGQSDCVYDFALSWRTDADYRSARELFEHYFYPAAIKAMK
jgi:hypothetical protein